MAQRASRIKSGLLRPNINPVPVLWPKMGFPAMFFVKIFNFIDIRDSKY